MWNNAGLPNRGWQVRWSKRVAGCEFASKGIRAPAAIWWTPCSHVATKKSASKDQGHHVLVGGLSIFAQTLVTHGRTSYNTSFSPFIRSAIFRDKFEHATHLTDWSCLNVQLFNFHAAGSPVQESILAQSKESQRATRIFIFGSCLHLMEQGVLHSCTTPLWTVSSCVTSETEQQVDLSSVSYLSWGGNDETRAGPKLCL